LGQFTQYRAPGSQAERKTEIHQELRESLNDARWTAGPLRIDPWIGIRELSWVDNVFADNGESVSDFTTTVGAGLRFFVPFGDSTISPRVRSLNTAGGQTLKIAGA